MTKVDNWYSIKNVAEIDTPALILYPQRIDGNIELLKMFVSDVAQLRPHVKTNKSAEVTRLMLAAGITKFKCATIAEAEMLAKESAPDVLLAYQPSGPKADRMCQLQAQYTKTIFSCMIDNETTLTHLSATAKKFNQTIRVFIDLNVGMNRTGIIPGKEAFELFKSISKTKNLAFIGLHAYDGHIRDTDLNLRTQKCDEAFVAITALRKEIATETGKEVILIAGGTPTFPIHAKKTDVESSPGTFVYWDYGYDRILHEQPFQFAALVITRVISKPNAHTICVDLGHKSIASENPLHNRVHFINEPGLEPIGHSEEHMVFKIGKDHAYEIGDVLYGIPHHICPTVALYDFASVCKDNVCKETWEIAARKRKLSI